MSEVQSPSEVKYPSEGKSYKASHKSFSVERNTCTAGRPHLPVSPLAQTQNMLRSGAVNTALAASLHPAVGTQGCRLFTQTKSTV